MVHSTEWGYSDCRMKKKMDKQMKELANEVHQSPTVQKGVRDSPALAKRVMKVLQFLGYIFKISKTKKNETISTHSR